MIRLTFKALSDKSVEAKIRAKGPKIVEEVTHELDLLMLELQRRVQQKLSGEVLQARSGRLLGSVNKTPTTQSGNTISGSVTAGAGPAFYGAIQEVGGTRSYEIKPVNKLALAFFPSNSLGATSLRIEGRRLFYKQGKRRGTLKSGAFENFTSLGGIVVKKVIHPPLQPRPFMSSALQEMTETIISRLKLAVARGVAS